MICLSPNSRANTKAPGAGKARRRRAQKWMRGACTHAATRTPERAKQNRRLKLGIDAVFHDWFPVHTRSSSAFSITGRATLSRWPGSARGGGFWFLIWPLRRSQSRLEKRCHAIPDARLLPCVMPVTVGKRQMMIFSGGQEVHSSHCLQGFYAPRRTEELATLTGFEPVYTITDNSLENLI